MPDPVQYFLWDFPIALWFYCYRACQWAFHRVYWGAFCITICIPEVLLPLLEYSSQSFLQWGQWQLSPLQSRHLRTSHSLPIQLPSAALSYFPESHQWSEISSLSKVILVLGNGRSCRAPNLGCRGAESPGWFDMSPKIYEQDVIHEQACRCDEAANH